MLNHGGMGGLGLRAMQFYKNTLILYYLVVKFDSIFEFLGPENIQTDTVEQNQSRNGVSNYFQLRVSACTSATSGKCAKFQQSITRKLKVIEKKQLLNRDLY